MHEDLTAFMVDFAETVTLTNGKTFKAVVDATFVGVGDGVAEVESSALSLLAQTADLTDVAFGTPVEMNNVQFLVRGMEPDGTGMTLLRLERA